MKLNAGQVLSHGAHETEPTALRLWAIVLTVALCLFAGLRPAAAEFTSGTLVPYSEMDKGGLFLPSDRPGYVTPATTVDSEIALAASGLVVRGRIVQHFVNPTDDWVEGVYVFPLPETAAVDRLSIEVGGRTVEGVIMERTQAQRTYETARDQGRRASLVSQERPNLFTNAVANIGPNDAITVAIEYQQSLGIDQDTYSLRMPLAVLPRYVPGTPIPERHAEPEGAGWAPDTDLVPDASRVTPPVADPAFGPVNGVHFTALLDPGFPVEEIDSPTHAIAVEALEDGRYRVTLPDEQVWADRDFELVWRPAPMAAPRAAGFTERLGDADYHLMMIMPPVAKAGDVVPAAGTRPREVVFIIDASGSMAGESIVQAKQALLAALARLAPEDRFNIIAFNDQAWSAFSRPRAAGTDAIAEAGAFIRGLSADGGTEMRPALMAALSTPVNTDGEHGRSDDPIRQVVFATDGSVANEAELLTLIDERLGDARLFTIGIGSAPNGYFLREAAAMGRGSLTYIDSTDEVAARMEALFAKLEHPTLTDITVSWIGAGGEPSLRPEDAAMYPAIAPDLYLGEPLTFTVRLPAGTRGWARIQGRYGDQPWRADVDLGSGPDNGEDSPGVATLWARNRITDLERHRYRGAAADRIRDEILKVALAHRIVSDVTSLVAVDEAVVRPPDVVPVTEAVATNMPHGVDMSMAATPEPKDESGSRDASVSPRGESIQAIRSMAAFGTPVSPTRLPATATPAGAHLEIGAVLLAAALLLLWLARHAPRLSRRRWA